jgi:RNA polymerase sigma-70 factor (ECF subfamily)
MSLIEEALSGLKPVFRTAVVLRDVEDLSYEEIAHILQVSLGTVKSRILRGRETLRRTLAGQFECPEAEWSDAGQVEFGSAKP